MMNGQHRLGVEYYMFDPRNTQNGSSRRQIDQDWACAGILLKFYILDRVPSTRLLIRTILLPCPLMTHDSERFLLLTLLRLWIVFFITCSFGFFEEYLLGVWRSWPWVVVVWIGFLYVNQ
jgi:hypothetical protein